VKDFHGLKVWSKAHALALSIYSATASFPRSEHFGLTDQTRRACTSIATNIAEGCGREGEAELKHFLSIARGSASELEYHLLLARDLHYLPPADHERLSNEVTQIKRMLTVFIQKLKADS
jgi:four helix bundle protein